MSIERSGKIAPQHQRVGGLAAVPRIVVGAARHFVKTGTLVKPKGRVVALVDLQENGTRAEPGQPAQMQIEQLTRKAPPAPRSPSSCTFSEKK